MDITTIVTYLKELFATFMFTVTITIILFMQVTSTAGAV